MHGAYVIGSSGIPLYDGTNLAARHDVVVVGLNHRLNFTGYLYLGGIGEEKYADSGNLGLLDIILALQWVRANIRSFGGDPTNVTIFGESDGGSQVTALMAMPSAKGLFQKAIVESGSDLRVSTREEADAMARRFLAQLHVAPDRVGDLRTIPMDRFIAAQATSSSRSPRTFCGGWGLLPRQSARLLNTPRQRICTSSSGSRPCGEGS